MRHRPYPRRHGRSGGRTQPIWSLLLLSRPERASKGSFCCPIRCSSASAGQSRTSRARRGCRQFPSSLQQSEIPSSRALSLASRNPAGISPVSANNSSRIQTAAIVTLSHSAAHPKRARLQTSMRAVGRNKVQRFGVLLVAAIVFGGLDPSPSAAAPELHSGHVEASVMGARNNCHRKNEKMYLVKSRTATSLIRRTVVCRLF